MFRVQPWPPSLVVAGSLTRRQWLICEVFVPRDRRCRVVDTVRGNQVVGARDDVGAWARRMTASAMGHDRIQDHGVDGRSAAWRQLGLSPTRTPIRRRKAIALFAWEGSDNNRRPEVSSESGADLLGLRGSAAPRLCRDRSSGCGADLVGAHPCTPLNGKPHSRPSTHDRPQAGR